MYSKKILQMFQNPKFAGEIKNADGVGEVGNMKCLLPNSGIHINNNLKEIKDIDTFDRVLSHDGFYNKVKRTYKRKYSNKIIEIKNKLGKTFLTPEHEVLAVKVPKEDFFYHYKNKKRLLVDWYHAGDLEKRDLILYPILKEVKDLGYIKFPQVKKKFDFRSKKIPERIKINEEFLRLAGYYLAEGHANDKVTRSCLRFAFHLNEDNLAQDVMNIIKKQFNIKSTKRIEKGRRTLIVMVSNVWLVRLFKSLFGVGASKKKIPDWMMLLPTEKQKSLIYGLWMGDGFFNEKKRAGYSTISYTLCHQIKFLLLRQRIVPSIYTEEEKIVNGVRHRKSYRIHVGNRESLEKLGKILNLKVKINRPLAIDSWFDDNFLYIPLTSVKKSNYKGLVHNLEIENSKSFTTESLTVHNCGDIMKVFIKIGNKNGEEVIKNIKYLTFGCVAAIASSEALCAVVKGKMVEEALKVSIQDLIDYMGGEVPPVKVHCSILAAGALKKAVEDYRKNKVKEK